VLTFLAFLTVISIGAFCSYAADTAQTDSRTVVTSDFIDLKFTINKKNYISKTVSKDLEVAPFISNGRTLVLSEQFLKSLVTLLIGMTQPKPLPQNTKEMK